MGHGQSKKHPPAVPSTSGIAYHIQNSSNSSTNMSNDISNNGPMSEDVINKLDKQYIDSIKKDLSETPELFVLNNMIMGVMFFENYSKFTEDLKKNRLDNQADYIVPDVILEKVSENVAFRPHHGPKKHESEPLVPKRIFVLNDWVKVVGTTEDAQEDTEQTTVRIEESRKKGYVLLRSVNSDFQSSGSSPIPRLDSMESSSRSSTDSSDTNYYSKLQDLKTPKPIEIIRGIQSTQSTLPKTCISYRKRRKISWDPDELRGDEVMEEDLYDTVAYVNSKGFMKELQNDLFLNGIASKLHIDIDDLRDSHISQEKIVCSIKQDEKVTPCEIMPSIKTSWPRDQTLTFLMKRQRPLEPRKRFIFPSASMIENITTFNCVLLPKGYVKKKGDRKDADIEWELNFPQAQRYLETFMTHAQMKSLLILITLHKTYIEPKTSQFGLLTEHIRNFILRECESNYSEWPEHRLGIKLIQVLKNLIELLSKPRPNIPDFFIHDKNSLNDVAPPKLRQAQKAFDEVLQAPVMYFMMALRNLRYTHGKDFFPPFEFKKLYEILKKSGLEFSNPQIRTGVKRTRTEHSAGVVPQFIDDPDIMVQQLKNAQKREQVLRKRQEEEEMERLMREASERKGSVDSIDINWSCEKTFDVHKKRVLLKFFIETFLGISAKCLELSSNSTQFYIKQAYYLAVILREENRSFLDEYLEYKEQIDNLESQYEKKVNKRPINGVTKPVEFVKNRANLVTNYKPTVQSDPKNARKSVTFVDVHHTSN